MLIRQVLKVSAKTHKNYLRSTMIDDRLTGVPKISLEKKTCSIPRHDSDEVVNTFAHSKSRENTM